MSETPLLCPKCRLEMAAETWEDVEIDRCGSCQGIFLDEGELSSLLRLRLGAEVDNLRYSSLSDMMDGLEATCPHCNVSMKPVTLHGVRIDRCPSCAGAFFDEGEVASLQLSE